MSERKNYAKPITRYTLRLTDVVKETGLHCGCGDYIGTWNWRQYGDFQRCERRSAAPVAVQRTRQTGARLQRVSGDESAENLDFRAGIRGHSGRGGLLEI